MALTVVGGRVRPAPTKSGLLKRRVSFMASFPFDPKNPAVEMQMIAGFMMVRRLAPVPNMPPRYEGPIAAGWANLVHLYPAETDGLHLLGVLIAEVSGQFEGHIDWVRQISEDDRKGVIDELGQKG